MNMKTATTVARPECWEMKVTQAISEPQHWLAAGLFLNISGITDYDRAFQSLESVVFIAGTLTALLKIWFSGTRENKSPAISPILGSIGLGILASTIISSYFNTFDLQIFADRGWKHFAKFMILVSLCLMAYPPARWLPVVYKSVYAGLVVLAGSCLVRFLLFQQFNQETGRMELIGRPGDPNFVCMYMTIGVTFSLTHLSAATRSVEKVWHLLFSTLFLSTAWFSESRVGLLVLTLVLLGLLFLLPWRFSKWRVSTLVFASAALIVVMFGDRLVERYVTIDDASNSGRWAGIVAAEEMIVEQPIWGSGYGSSHRYVQPHQDVLFKSSSIPLEIHTTPLQIFGEQGLMGLAAYGLLYVQLLVRSYRKLRTSWGRNRELGIVCGLSALAIVTNMISIPLSYIGTVHGMALVLLQMTSINAAD